MLDVHQIKKKLTDHSLRKVSIASGVSYDVVWRVANGKAKRPKPESIEKLNKYFQDREEKLQGA